jgi:Na+/H+ antiporter NhaC
VPTRLPFALLWLVWLTLGLPNICLAADGAEPHPYGIWSLAPPLVAVVLAIATRRIYLSLLAGVFAGALITSPGIGFPIDLAKAVSDFAEVHLWATFTGAGRLRLFAFILFMGATIGVIYAGGGMQGLVSLMEPLARSRRSGQITAWLAGLIIFFDDYANTLLVGNTFRSTFDRLKVSREKLSYIVDSTSAPVAGLAVISTWIAVELEYIDNGINQLSDTVGQNLSSLDLFIACLPYRFYVIQALVFVPLVAIMGREFGPMLGAERRRLAAKEDPTAPAIDADQQELEMRSPSHWANAVVPLAVLLGVVVGLLWYTGVTLEAAAYQQQLAETAGDQAAIQEIEDKREANSHGWAYARLVMKHADSSLALQYGGLAGLVVAFLMVRVGGLLSTQQCTQAALVGARMMLPALMILGFASALSNLTTSESYLGEPSQGYEHQDHRLYTGEYLVQQLDALADDPASSALLVAALPTIVFLTSCAIAFSTGTSYGTMGLVIPMVIPLTIASMQAAGREITPDDPILLASLGAVLAGAIFGDHCSPISDTTILSSQASGCEVMAHVNTQLPYALACAGVAVLLGTVLVGVGISVWILLPLQTLALVAIIRWVGRRVEP